MRWLDCDDEIKMFEFLGKISDESKLRQFALELACTVLEDLEDKRLIKAVDATENFLNGAIVETDLKTFYDDAELALAEIELGEMDQVEDEMGYERGLVVLYAAIPPHLSGSESSLWSARDSALHAAHYCRLIIGSGELENQVVILDMVGLPSVV